MLIKMVILSNKTGVIIMVVGAHGSDKTSGHELMIVVVLIGGYSLHKALEMWLLIMVLVMIILVL